MVQMAPAKAIDYGTEARIGTMRRLLNSDQEKCDFDGAYETESEVYTGR